MSKLNGVPTTHMLAFEHPGCVIEKTPPEGRLLLDEVCSRVVKAAVAMNSSAAAVHNISYDNYEMKPN